MVDYENPWTLNNIPFETNDIEEYYGFVYLITNLTNDKKYIGRKYFWKNRKGKGRKRIKSESDWKTYYGSNDDLQLDVIRLGSQNFKREILSLHKTKGATNYSEIEEQINRRVIFSENYYNKSINGKYYNVKLDESEYTEPHSFGATSFGDKITVSL